jgi:hypothetical protein
MKISDIEFYGSVYKKGGTSGQFLKADGSIDSSAYITLGSLSVTAPLTYNSSTGAFNINQATSTTSGWLSYDDWVTFNGKQAAGNYVTTDTTQTISGAKTFTTQLWIGANAVIGSTNGQIQMEAAASSDLFISCIAGTRTLQIRNGNAGAPNYGACGLITGYIELRNNLLVSTNDVPSSNNIDLARNNDGYLINATISSSNVMSLIAGGAGTPDGSYGILTLGKNGYDKMGFNADGNSWISTAPSFSSNGNYALSSTNNITINASQTFNSGGIWGSTNATNLVNWNGSNTIPSGATMAGEICVNRHIFKASSLTITYSQSTGIRASAALQVLQQTGGNYAGTISHGAGLFIQGVYPTTAYNTTFTNYYGLLINPLDEWGGVTLTNRWGIYQAGASDKNYLAGSLGVGKLLNSWGGSLSALQVGTRGAIWARDSDGLVVFGSNSYFDGTYDKQILTGYSNRIYFLNGQMTFETAASTSGGSNTPWATTMTISAANEITSWNGEMYFKRSAFANYGHIYCGSDRHFYLRNSGAYNMYLQTNGVNQIILQNDGVTKVSNLRTSTLYSEYTKVVSGGGFTAGTWYEVVNTSILDQAGTYMITAYVDTYAIGGGTYFSTFSSVPFYWFAGGSNSGDILYLPSMFGTGHHGLGGCIDIRLRLEQNVYGSKQYIEWSPRSTLGTINGGGGQNITIYVKRLGA